MAKTETLFDSIGVYLLLYEGCVLRPGITKKTADSMKISTNHHEPGKEGKFIFTNSVLFSVHVAGADPGFLEGEFRCVDDGVRFADLKYPMKTK